MASVDYSKVKTGKLKLKGQKTSTKKAQKRKAETEVEQDVDALDHGGWWHIKDEAEVKGGMIAIESLPFTYIAALDNGFFSLGGPHASDEPPAAEEILTLFKPPDSNWICLKSGYNKYLGVDKSGTIVAVSEAIGPREKWEIVFENGESALQATATGCFLSFHLNEDGYIHASNKKAGSNEMIKLRTNRERDTPFDFTPADDKKKAGDCETSYVKLYQHSKVKINQEARSNINTARDQGTLHETLLDRRTKMKSDKFCN